MSSASHRPSAGDGRQLREVAAALSMIDPLGATVRGAALEVAPPVYTSRRLAEAGGVLEDLTTSLDRSLATADRDDRVVLVEAQRTVQRVAAWIEWVQVGDSRGLLALVTALGIALQTRTIDPELRREVIQSVRRTVEATVSSGGFSGAPLRGHQPTGAALIRDLREVARLSSSGERDELGEIADHLEHLVTQSAARPGRGPARAPEQAEPSRLRGVVPALQTQCHELASFIDDADRSGYGLSWCDHHTGWLPDEPGSDNPRFSRAGRGSRIDWITSELGRHHRDHAPAAPPPVVLVDRPIVRLLAPNAASYPIDDGSSAICVNTMTFAAERPMSVRGRGFLSMLAAHEGVPGHSLHHWLGRSGPNGPWHSLLHNEPVMEGWGMYVERMIALNSPEPYQVVWAYHALRRILPATARAIAITDPGQARGWVRDLLQACPSVAAEAASPSRFGSVPDHYAVGLHRWGRLLGNRGLDEVTRSILARGRVDLGADVASPTSAVVTCG